MLFKKNRSSFLSIRGVLLFPDTQFDFCFQTEATELETKSVVSTAMNSCILESERAYIRKLMRA